jgi:hypothetical protein
MISTAKDVESDAYLLAPALPKVEGDTPLPQTAHKPLLRLIQVGPIAGKTVV